MKRRGLGIVIWFCVFLVIAGIWYSLDSRQKNLNNVNEIYNLVSANAVSYFDVKPGNVSPAGTVLVVKKDSQSFVVNVTDVNDIQKLALENNIDVFVEEGNTEGILDYIIPKVDAYECYEKIKSNYTEIDENVKKIEIIE